MKFKYHKPLRFPVWSRMKPELADLKRYHAKDNGIETVFDDNSFYPHTNHIETAGFYCSTILSYRVNKNRTLTLYRYVTFPSLRINPNNTGGSLAYAFPGVSFKINGKSESVKSIFFNGIVSFASTAGGAEIRRDIFTAPDKKALIEEVTVECENDSVINLKGVSKNKKVSGVFTNDGKSVTLQTRTYLNNIFIENNGKVTLRAGKNTLLFLYSAESVTPEEASEQKAERLKFIEESAERLGIITPDDDINREIQFAKIRASESIFKTKGGLMHSPGGGSYYAAMWTNDQCEYANPFFAYLGYDIAKEQSLNCYDLYSKLAKPDEAIFTSIIAEGDDYWHGAGDRGDSSMYVYGFSRFLLTTGDKADAEKYLPALETACTYVMSKMNAQNVVESDSDELENRFESGKANLSTAVITYDAFVSMAYLEAELGNVDKSEIYREFAEKVKSGISSYFEANVEGYDTYRYCAEESRLRAWICLPLTVGIDNRVDGTVKALQSDKLKKTCGLLTRAGEKTFWDRALLYALRGLFYVGEADAALKMLTEYTATRLYGEHSPYPIEAFPEGNGAHLSAESALYVRIFTEGVLGFRPTGFNSFELKINLPSAWNNFTVSQFAVVGKALNISVIRNGENYTVEIPEIGFSSEVKANSTIKINF